MRDIEKKLAIKYTKPTEQRLRLETNLTCRVVGIVQIDRKRLGFFLLQPNGPNLRHGVNNRSITYLILCATCQCLPLPCDTLQTYFVDSKG